MLGEADLVASGREDWARVINLPDAGIAREVNGIGGWVSHPPKGVRRRCPELQKTWRRIECQEAQSAGEGCSTGQRKGLEGCGENRV